MNRLRLPLWLICDSAAALRLWGGLALFFLVLRRVLPRGRLRPFLSPEAAAWLIEILALCESLLRWVIARQAFRLCGLDPARARLVLLAGAETPLAWHVRHRTFRRRLNAMTACARTQARRIRQALAAATPAWPAAPLTTSTIPTPTIFPSPVSGARTPQPWTRGIPAPP